MAQPKYKQLFSNDSAKKESRKNHKQSKEEIAIDKVKISQMKDIISKKLKDPEMAKKAAQIISDMINSKE